MKNQEVKNRYKKQFKSSGGLFIFLTILCLYFIGWNETTLWIMGVVLVGIIGMLIRESDETERESSRQKEYLERRNNPKN